MTKKLVRTGNSLALVLDKALLEATGIDADTPIEISTNGEVIVLSPARSAKRRLKLKKVMDRAHLEFGGAFRRLAK
jgi:antitoxin component of MazEF toxin-antitoxin module